MKIFLFSGTSEGRKISEALSKAAVFHTVFVATEYGRLVMEPSDYTQIKEGRLTEEDMTSLFMAEKPDYVVDATHPYAVEVTANLKAACHSSGCGFLRIWGRFFCDVECPSVTDTKEAISYLKSTTGNILLTTGVKSLPEYLSDDEIKDRIYARILPSIESLSIALDAGIKPGHVIAQEGPFTVESNEALISQYDIKVLVTKNSGNRGGFNEKLIACENKKIKTLVIAAKSEEDGITVNEAIRKLTGADYTERKATIVGIGPGNPKLLTVAAKETIEKADMLIGAKRMIEFGEKINPKAAINCEYEATKIVEAIRKSEAQTPVILMSGDTGFHSGTKKARTALMEEGYEVTVLPGISSISYFASIIGWEYSDAKLLSFHGEKTDLNQEIKGCDKFFCILSGPADIEMIKAYLGESWEVAVGFNLGYEDQSIDITKADKIKTYTQKGLYVLGAKNAKA